VSCKEAARGDATTTENQELALAQIHLARAQSGGTIAVSSTSQTRQPAEGLGVQFVESG
jgi:hypothetical protein